MKKFLMTALILTVICALLFTAACKTSAAWGNQTSESQGSDVKVTKSNGSERYIVYAALDSSGNLLANSASDSLINQYAVVGYVGEVAELVIPDTYNGKNVTKVLVAAPYSAYKCYMNGAAYPATYDDNALANNPVVTSIVFGANVREVGANVCMTMAKLTTVTFLRNAGVTLGAEAFFYCTNLTTVRFTATMGNVSLGTNAFSGCGASPLTPTYGYSAS